MKHNRWTSKMRAGKPGPWHLIPVDGDSLTLCGRRLTGFGIQTRPETESPDSGACKRCVTNRHDGRQDAWRRTR